MIQNFKEHNQMYRLNYDQQRMIDKRVFYRIQNLTFHIRQ